MRVRETGARVGAEPNLVGSQRAKKQGLFLHAPRHHGDHAQDTGAGSAALPPKDTGARLML